MKITKQNKTKVQLLVDEIMNHITTGVYKEGDPLPSINQISKRQKVSRDTVFKALNILKDQGILNSIHGKNYHIAKTHQEVLLVLEEYSPYKEIFYKSLTKYLPATFKLDVVFHLYNEELFQNIIEQSQGRYYKYIIMNYQNLYLPKILNKLDADKLLLIDFGDFEKGDLSYVCQNFDSNFYACLKASTLEIQKYKKLVMISDERKQHPKTGEYVFKKFCEEIKIPSEVSYGFGDTDKMEINSCYIIARLNDLVELVRQANTKGLIVGKDYGIIAYNDIPLYDILCNGITSFSVDWKDMGEKVAQFIMQGKPIQITLPTQIFKRKSL